MLFKLAISNLKKSFKDYAIYFLTLVLGVAIFYMFNSLDSQQAMIAVSASQRDMIKLLISILGYISVFVAVVLGLLIVYANNFLINRRKKEFGIYMTLGMGKHQISKILLLETVFVGAISLGVGLIVGIFGSQLMSIVVAKMFEANMTSYQFVFSGDACLKTCVYFAVMYFAVMLFNTFVISRYKLINLLNATKKNEKVKIKNPILCVAVFLIACVILGWAYWKVTGDIREIDTAEKILPPILAGVFSTVLIFWSISGFALQVIQKKKSTYLKGTNMFVLRQINNKINTMVVSMSVICLMLFMTISVLSSALALRNTTERELAQMTPVDLNLSKEAYLSEDLIEAGVPAADIINSRIPLTETLERHGLNLSVLKDIIEIPIYLSEGLNYKDTIGNYLQETGGTYMFLYSETAEEIIKVSDYNKIAKLYGLAQFELNDDEYMIVCNFDSMAELRKNAIAAGYDTINLGSKTYHLKYRECQDGFIEISSSHQNLGLFLVPDNAPLTQEMQHKFFLAANYNANTDEGKTRIEAIFTDSDSGLNQSLLSDGRVAVDGVTKISILEAGNGLSIIVMFIAIYLGIIFLIASSAILALKQLTDSSDNKQRYTVLRKIGCDEKMINSTLFKQIGIFFGAPLILAVIHSIFGIQFAIEAMAGLASKDDLIPSAVATAIIIGVVYGAYFLATYLGSKNIIKDEK